MPKTKITRENIALYNALKRTEDIVDQQCRDELMKYLGEIARYQNRRYYKQNHDAEHRRLVGAMLPIDIADKMKRAATVTGRSMYQFVCDALREEYMRYIRHAIDQY